MLACHAYAQFEFVAGLQTMNQRRHLDGFGTSPEYGKDFFWHVSALVVIDDWLESCVAVESSYRRAMAMPTRWNSLHQAAFGAKEAG